jgi:hypothetical protein
MICRRIDLPGGTAIVCSRGERPKLCATCKRRPSTKLCDFKLTGRKAGKTCDAKLCDACAVSGGAGIDYCPPHARIRHGRDQPGWEDVAPDDETWTHVFSVDGRVWKRGEEWPMSIVSGGLRFVRAVEVES